MAERIEARNAKLSFASKIIIPRYFDANFRAFSFAFLTNFREFEAEKNLAPLTRKSLNGLSASRVSSDRNHQL